MFCQKCGNQVEENQKFCTKCGEKIVDSTLNKKQNNKLYDNWWFWIIIIIIIITVMSIATYNSKVNNGRENVNIYSNKTNTNEDRQVEGEGNIGKSFIKILDYKVVSDYGDKSILLVKISYTNNNDEARSFSYNLDCKAYQNGIELSTPISSYGIEELDWKDKNKEIKQGVTYEFNFGFYLDSPNGDVEVEVLPHISNKYSEKVTKTVKLK